MILQYFWVEIILKIAHIKVCLFEPVIATASRKVHDHSAKSQND